MVVRPDSALDVLGFESIRARVAALLESEDARRLWLSLLPANSTNEARSRLQATAEFQFLLRSKEPVRVGEAFRPDAMLARARPRASMLEVEEIRHLADLARDAEALRSYASRCRSDAPRLWSVAGNIVPLPDFVNAVESAIDERGFVRDDASPRLRSIRRSIGKAESSLRASLDRALANARSGGFDGGDQPTVRNGRMVIPVRVEAKRKVAGFVHDISSSGQTAFIEPQESLDLNNELNELRADEKREIRAILMALTDSVRETESAIRVNAGVLLELDVVRALAEFANSFDGIVPDISEGLRIELRGARHPILLLRALDESGSLEQASRQVVPLELELGESCNTLVLSGPNAGGKTVVLKTVGLFVLMVAHGLPVSAAPHSILPYPSKLMLDIGDEQSVENDLSTFGARVVRLRDIAEHADSETLVLIDEAGTGTDPNEGAALAQAVLEWLSDVGALTVASTHHQRLKVFAMEHPRVANGSMLVDPDSLEPTYRFQAGTAGSSFGLVIARREGLPEKVIQRAESLAGDASVRLDSLLAEQAEHLDRLRDERAEARQARDAAKAESAAVAQRAEELERKGRIARERAAREARNLVEAANARIEKTIREIKESGADKKKTRDARVELESFRQEMDSRAGEDERSPEPKTQRDDGGPLEPGDQVVLDGGSSAAEVVSVGQRKIEISTGSMRMRVDRSRLTKVGRAPGQRTSVKRSGVSSSLQGGQGSSATRRNRGRQSELPEAVPLRLDLRGERVDEAVWRVTRHVDAAITGGLHEVEILHGKGTGALRRAIREYLSTRPDVASFDDAPMQQGGDGVTVVRLT